MGNGNVLFRLEESCRQPGAERQFGESPNDVLTETALHIPYGGIV